MKIKKAIIPAAGFGTRFLPFTKASPKEMLPIVDKPVIQYVVEEAVAAGIEHIIIITGSNKRAIEDHFDYNFELEHRLQEVGKMDEYNEIRAISDMAKFTYIRQREQLGNGHAVLCAREVINHEPFAVLWGDNFMAAEPASVKQMIEAYEKHPGCIIGSQIRDSEADYKRYGYGKGEEIEPGIYKISDIIEKPGAKDPSLKVAFMSGYILTPEILDVLSELKPGIGGEIYLADGLKGMIDNGLPVYAKVIENSKFYDCGDKLEYLKANLDFAMKREELAPGLTKYMKDLLAEAEDSKQ
ncbi:MAG: UTP--glucose-1-phosphate uridylyltransferase [bacterium]|nr:UTP--glucose-1-phosphate uridylyltransferase [bacterium]